MFIKWKTSSSHIAMDCINSLQFRCKELEEFEDKRELEKTEVWGKWKFPPSISAWLP